MTYGPEKHPGDEEVFALVHGLLTGPARAELLEHVRACGECESLMRSLSRTREIARADGRRPVAFPRSSSPAVGWGSWRKAAYIGALAALFLIMLGVRDYRSKHVEQGELWLSTTLEMTSMRTADEPVPEGFAEALALYEKHDASGAAGSLSALHLSGGWAGLRDVYLCSALANAGRFKEMIPVLVRLDVPTLPREYRIPVEWYRYRMLVGTGRAEQALGELRSLAVEEGEVGELARAALAEKGDQGRP